MNALLHRLDRLERELSVSTERCEVLESNKSILEADNERMSALCDNKDVSHSSRVTEVVTKLIMLSIGRQIWYISLCIVFIT